MNKRIIIAVVAVVGLIIGGVVVAQSGRGFNSDTMVAGSGRANTNELKYQIKIYSGGQQVGSWSTNHGVGPYGSGFTFYDPKTEKTVVVSGDVVILKNE